MPKSPNFDVFVTDKPSDPEAKPYWTKIGAGWDHGDGEGINILLQALPIGGQLILRKHKPKE